MHNSYSPDGLLSLPNMIPAGSLGVGEGLPDDVLKVGVHGLLQRLILRPLPGQ